MQTGFFYVRLKDNLDPAEQGVELSGRIEHLEKVFKKGKAYPVLAVEFREANRIKQTFYHIPTESNEIGWFSSEYFLFARD